MKHNTFEPCKDHANGHFGWCLLCENNQKRNFIEQQAKRIDELELEVNMLRKEKEGRDPSGNENERLAYFLGLT